MMPAGVLAPIPACMFFAFIERYLIQGLTAGGLKRCTGGRAGSPRAVFRATPRRCPS
jgi:hypothetical protein